ncbi:MAG: aminotransferase class III-fold pyridoxal phosphate-dependent enzyme [Bacteroidota bacterium]
MNTNYSSILIDCEQAAQIAKMAYGIGGEIKSLPGELDFNFKITQKDKSYVLKISRPNSEKDYIDFQEKLLIHLRENPLITSPEILPDNSGKYTSEYTDKQGNIRFIRLLTWIDGRMWTEVNPKREELLNSLGFQAGQITKALHNFKHPAVLRKTDWDISNSLWVKEYLNLFDSKRKTIVLHFIRRFEKLQKEYKTLRSATVHNDVNDNNILVSYALTNPEVSAIIDYGDAIHTKIINDLAITLAYALMNKPDPLQASLPIIAGYHKAFPLQKDELRFLYVLVAMRLIISVSKSAINLQKEPENSYLQISEKPAWQLLEKWIEINENLAHYSFRKACAFTAHPNENRFNFWAKKQQITLRELFPSLNTKSAHKIDMSVTSNWIGHEHEFNDNELFDFKIKQVRKKYSSSIIAGGYNETRAFYITDAYKKEGNSGPEYRSVHLGIDFWVKAKTPIQALFDGKVFSVRNNKHLKDYGPTLILQHNTDNGIPFFSLYGHCSKDSLNLHKAGALIKRGDLIAYVGNEKENGSWAPHLHFQIMLDMLGNKTDFPGVSFPSEIDVMKSICPNPNLLFKLKSLKNPSQNTKTDLLVTRKQFLGKSLSLAYSKPLEMVRGQGVYLIDSSGRKFLDTVNNVAHVGHEHHRVVDAGQKQMAILNTNTRYLHKNINELAKELLSTFPKELSVVHFVNSGSEANELALRMAYASTGQKDIIAVEVGYHGNTNACVKISSYKFDGKGGKGAPEHTHIVPLPDSYRGLFRGENTAINYAYFVQEKIDYIRSKKRKPAAFICESIISCGGQIELPKDYLAIAYDLVRKSGGICIADEVQTGCGRVGQTFWGFQMHQVIPDIVTIGKPIGNGHPLAAVVCTQKVAEAFANGMEYFNTFGGNPVSCAIGLEVLKVIKEESLQKNALESGNYLKKKLRELQNKFPLIGHVRGQGLFLGFELVDKDKNPQTEKANYLVNRMKELGILMSTDGKDNNVLKIKPPLLFSKTNADELIGRLETVLNEDFMLI